MIPEKALPLHNEWENTEEYVESLLSFATSSTLFRNLCGGVHILEFLTREPDLFSTLFPEDWREFFDQHAIGDILDLLLRENIEPLRRSSVSNENENFDEPRGGKETTWRNGPVPPQGLLEYIRQIRRHAFRREFTPKTDNSRAPIGKIPHHVAVGMKPKKVHEVENFSHYVSSLAADIDQASDRESEDRKSTGGITHIVDFGSGQNYLGRTLVSPQYNKHVIAIEQKQENISGAKGKDSAAKLTKKKVVLKNKKELRARKHAAMACQRAGSESTPGTGTPIGAGDESEESSEKDSYVTVIQVPDDNNVNESELAAKQNGGNGKGDSKKHAGGHIDYVEHEIQDGYLEPIIDHIVKEPQHSPAPMDDAGQSSSSCSVPRVMVVSLHSCGNLIHHGIRSLILNPSVAAVAMIGCCYNLMTERLGPLTWKLPSLRSKHPRLERTSTAYDPHGFPLSRRLETYAHESGEGIILNITARMMAVQAPGNWGSDDSEGFFKRHFFRSLLQRILLDYGIVSRPGVSDSADGDSDPAGSEAPSTPLIVGSLRKSAFTSFPVYARAATAKLARNEDYGAAIRAKVSTLSDDEFDSYERRYWSGKKNLSITWSMMAFSAQVAEAIIVTDRWLFLREQDEVKHAWVEPVFDYSQSPRNLVVVGMKS